MKIDAIGITNQRETVIAWNARTGIPYFNAIVWDDTRTDDIVKQIANQGNCPPGVERVDKLRERTGLPLATYFSGSKVRWLIDNVKSLRLDLEGAERSNVRFGTIDRE